MKTALLLSSLFMSSIAFASDDFIVNSEIVNRSAKKVVLAITAEYESSSSNPFCKRYSLPDGQGSVSNKTVSMIHFSGEGLTQNLIPVEFGICKYTLQNVSVGVYKEAVVAIVAKNGKRVEENVFELRGALGGNDLALITEVGAPSFKTLNCKPSANEGWLALDCGRENLRTNGTHVNLKIQVSQ